MTIFPTKWRANEKQGGGWAPTNQVTMFFLRGQKNPVKLRSIVSWSLELNSVGLIFACLGCHFRLGSKGKLAKWRVLLVEGLHPIWSHICRKFPKKKKHTFRLVFYIIQSLLGSCKAEFIQELDAQKKMGPPRHPKKKGWLREKAVMMMKASILLQVTLPEKKWFSSPCVSGRLKKGTLPATKIMVQWRMVPFKTKTIVYTKTIKNSHFPLNHELFWEKAYFRFPHLVIYFVKKNIIFFTFCGIWWEVYSSMMMGRRATSISPANCQGFTSSFKPPAPANASPSLNPLKTSREVDKRTRESKGGKKMSERVQRAI